MRIVEIEGVHRNMALYCRTRLHCVPVLTGLSELPKARG